MLLICFSSLHPKSSGQDVHWNKQISLFTWWNDDGSQQEQISNSSLERRWILFQHKAATHPCWTDHCIWHISSCNKEKAIVLVLANTFWVQSLIFGSNLRHWGALLLSPAPWLHGQCTWERGFQWHVLIVLCPWEHTFEEAAPLHCTPEEKKS